MPNRTCKGGRTCCLSAILLFFLVTPSAFAQQPPSPADSAAPEQPSPPATATPSHGPINQKNKKPETEEKPLKYDKDRVLWVAPNYLTVENPQQPFVPMTVREKFYLASRVAFDPFAFPEAAVLAMTNSQNTRQWGNSAGGLAERYAAAFADMTISTFTKKAIVPSILRQDPRYFRLGDGSLFKRTGYAFSRVLVTKNDAGNWTFNSSNLIGTAMGAAASDLYYPAQERTVSSTLSRWGTQLAVNAVDNWLREYWPDVRHRLLHK